MQKLQELIKECSKAEDSSRELDCKIWEVFHGNDMYYSIMEKGGDFCVRYYPGPPGPEYHRLPKYTKSIDDALTLIPEDWTRAVDASVPSFGIDVVLYPLKTEDDPARGTHVSEALATCIAAMKAKNANNLQKHTD